MASKIKPLFNFDTESYFGEDGGRRYKTPRGDYESVTTLLGKYSQQDTTGLDKWKKRVGEKKADAIMKSAGRRGKSLHEMIEKYLKGEDHLIGHMPSQVELFRSIKPVLDEFEEVYGLEQACYSDSLRMAGRVDCIARIRGMNVVVDFKNARSKKKLEWVHNYFLQATSYSILLKEQFDFKTDLFMILIANHNATKQVFFDNPRNFINDPFFKNIYNRPKV